MTAMPAPVPAGKLTYEEWGALARLLRRFEMHHCAPAPDEGREYVVKVEQMIRNTYVDLYLPADPSPLGSDQYIHP